MWLGVVGCLFDYLIPDFIKEFKKDYPDLIDDVKKDPGYILYETDLGKLVKVFAFNIKGNGPDVKKALKYMEEVSSPYEILNQTTEAGTFLYNRYKKINYDYEKILKKARSEANNEKILLFNHPHLKYSFATDLATELSYFYQDKLIIVAREKDEMYRLSIRDKKLDLRNVLKKALSGLEGYGGGHKSACGASVSRKDYNTLIEKIKKEKK
jgi:hypothetical protein